LGYYAVTGVKAQAFVLYLFYGAPGYRNYLNNTSTLRAALAALLRGLVGSFGYGDPKPYWRYASYNNILHKVINIIYCNTFPII
jgi:hypothetical protein